MGSFRMILLGEFDTILYDEKPLSPEEYLKGIDKPTLLMLASSMLGYNPNTSKYNNWRELVNMWFREQNLGFKKKIWERCERLEFESKGSVSLLSPVASLRFFEFVFSLSPSEIIQDEATSEINLFKAYLLFLTNTTKNETLSKAYLEELDYKIRAAATLLNQAYPVADFSNYDLGDIFVTQIIKACFLFEFFESSPESEYLITAFYNSFQLKHWKEYFQFIIPIIQAHTKHPSEGWTQLNVERNQAFERNCFFLEAIALKKFDIESNADFKLLRGNPLYKINEGLYAIISPLFVFEKIYKGLYFKLKEIHDTLPKEQRAIKNFRSFYTSNFSENYLLYKILEYIYGDRYYIKFSGRELADNGNIGAPDYYIRNGNYLFLFENKDVFINAEIKQSSNFRVIEEEFKKKFYFENKDGRVEPKAILQLTNNIKLALAKQNKFDIDYKANRLRIYPILILHDASFNSPGFNFLLNYWFSEEMAKLNAEGIDTAKVKPITVINIDTLILYADFLRLKKETLNDLIDAYIKFCSFNEKGSYKDFEHFKESYANTLLSFSFYIDNYTNVGFREVEPLLRDKIMNKIVN